MSSNTELLNIMRTVEDINSLLKTKASKAYQDASISTLTVNNLNVGSMGNILELLAMVSQNNDGRMSKEDKKKLDGIEAGANNYTHPSTHPASMIVETSEKRFVTDAQIAAWTAKLDRAGDIMSGNLFIKTSNANMLWLNRTGTNLNNSIKFSLKDETINKYFGLYDQEFRIGDSEDLSSGNKVWHSGNSYVVPTPESANNAKFLRNDNTWQLVTPSNIGAYTKDETYSRTEVDNKISQLTSGIDWRASVNTYADLATTYPNPEDGWTVNVKDTDYTYRWSGTEWIVISANAIPLANQNTDGKMSKEDKNKLDLIEAGANNYTHPSTHPASMIVEDSTHKFVTQALIDTWNLRITPAKETVNNARFLRNDNTWQTITPGNIGTYTSEEIDNKLNGRVLNSYLQSQSVSNCNSAFGAGVVAKYSTSSATGKPEGSDHALLSLAYSDSWFYQMAGDWRTGNLYVRGSNNNASSPLPWRTVYHSGNSYVVPTPESANNAKFLRNDNTWQLVTPSNIGAYTKDEVNNLLNNRISTSSSGSYEVSSVPWNNKSGAYVGTYSGASSLVWQMYTGSGSTPTAQLRFNYKNGGMWYRSARDSAGFEEDWTSIWTSKTFNPSSYLPLAGGTMTGPITKSAASCSWVNVKDGVNANIGLQQTAFTGWNPLIRIRSDGGWWGVGTYSGATNFNIVGFTDAQTANSPTAHFRIDLSGNGVCSGTFSASKVYNAVWNDYAELFPKLKSTITEAGDIIALDIENVKEVYTKATENSSSFIVGVHSDEYGQLLGGNKPPIDYEGDLYEFNKDKFIPVGLAGRVKAKCIGIIKKGDKLVISDIPGVARAFDPKLDNINNVFGMAVENKNNPDVITRVRMFIKN